jgi:D-alanyl-lipoteichoic acid acyltransferase DltB (MBOAT superfamily)
MLFNTWQFAAFFVVVYSLYLLLDQRRQNLLLLVASWIFYACFNWRFLFLLLTSTVVDFWVGRLLEPAAGRNRRRLVTVSVVVNLSFLAVFKYFNFFIGSAAALLHAVGLQVNAPVLQVVLPVGLSFYTFQAMSYTIDVYRRDAPACRDFVDFALYVAYFPHLVAGPIQRTDDLLPQLQRPRHVTVDGIASGSLLVLIGFLRKVATADTAAPLVGAVFSAPWAYTQGAVAFGVFLFAVQIYGDFAGYTDMARGISRMMGIELIENFHQPYFATNVRDFWQRWHISLSRWLRHYLYIPLGGNRGPQWFVCRNLMLTMLLGGLWHGASWHFVVWGGLHGLALIVHRFWSRRRPDPPESEEPSALRRVKALVSWGLTMLVVLLSWVFFRAPTLGAAVAVLRALAHPSGTTSTTGGRIILVPILLMLWIDVLQYRRRDQTCMTRWHWLPRGLFIGLVLVTILIWGWHDNAVPFIYFQF